MLQTVDQMYQPNDQMNFKKLRINQIPNVQIQYQISYYIKLFT